MISKPTPPKHPDKLQNHNKGLDLYNIGFSDKHMNTPPPIPRDLKPTDSTTKSKQEGYESNNMEVTMNSGISGKPATQALRTLHKLKDPGIVNGVKVKMDAFIAIAVKDIPGKKPKIRDKYNINTTNANSSMKEKKAKSARMNTNERKRGIPFDPPPDKRGILDDYRVYKAIRSRNVKMRILVTLKSGGTDDLTMQGKRLKISLGDWLRIIELKDPGGNLDDVMESKITGGGRSIHSPSPSHA